MDSKRRIAWANAYKEKNRAKGKCVLCPTPAAVKLIMQNKRVVYKKTLSICYRHLQRQHTVNAEQKRKRMKKI